MLMLHATKQQVCRYIEGLLASPLCCADFEARNLMFFEYSMDRDPVTAYRAYQQVASFYAKVMDHDPDESLESAVKRVLFVVRDDILSGQIPLSLQFSEAMVDIRARFDEKVVSRRHHLREEYVLMPGIPEHLEDRITMAVMMAESLAEESKSYEKQLPEIVDRIRSKIPDIMKDEKGLTLGKAMFESPQDIKDLVDDSHFTVKMSVHASQLIYEDLEADVQAAMNRQSDRGHSILEG